MWLNISEIKGRSLLLSSVKFSAVENLSESDTKKIFEIEKAAANFNPFDFLPFWLAGRSADQMGDDEVALFYFKKAMHKNPVYGALLQDFGKFMSEIHRLDIAEKFMLAGIKYDRISSVRYKTYAEWLLANGRKDRGIDTMRTAISMNVNKSRSYIDIMDKLGLSFDDIKNSLPNRVEPNIVFAEFLLDKGKKHEAETTYLKAFNYLDNEDTVSEACFFKASGYFTKDKQYDEALNILLKGIEYLPDNAKIRIFAASLYEKVGIPYRAIEEYKNALILDPKNRHVRNKLKKLSET
jgi:tetratricopeptide (TPR) repeat protein